MGRPLLLHLCCGPCGLVPVQRLRDEGFDVTGYFANPNIHPVREYLARREAAQQAAQRLDIPLICQDDVYDLPGWLAAVQPVADNADFARCRWCYAGRLCLCAAAAAALGFEHFSTSLLYSRHQQHEIIREEGDNAAALLARQGSQVSFVYRDFRPGWEEGIALSKSWELYRQNYCACIYSEAERYAKKLRRLTESATN